ncbi:uncharacterized protein TNCV_3580381 [Trichonephila clavipes]|nr:uncharacterized protein TNCV_3580381 [Trichonephila clavipes]
MVLSREDQIMGGYVLLLRKGCHIRFTAVAHFRTAVSTTLTQRTVRNRLLQGQLRTRCPIVCIPLTPSHCRLLRQMCQARAH